MDVDDCVPFLLRHVGKHPVAQDSGVVDHSIEAAEGLDRHVDHPLSTVPIGHVVAVRNCLTTPGNDLVDNLLGGRYIGSRTVALATKIVHDNLRSVTSQAHRMLATDPPACASDDCDLAFTESCHAEGLYESAS